MSLFDGIRYGEVYSFELHPTVVLAHSVENAKVISLLNGMTAQRLGYDVATKHAQIFASLPMSSFTSDFQSQMYVEVEYESGARDVFGESWIKAETFRRQSSTRYIAVFDNVPPDMENALEDVFSANGFKLISLTKE